MFSEWLADHGLEMNFESLDTDNLGDQLRRFYGHLASKSREEYSKSSLVNLRAGLKRHLTSLRGTDR